jgi:hypothetical protein
MLLAHDRQDSDIARATNLNDSGGPRAAVPPPSTLAFPGESVRPETALIEGFSHFVTSMTAPIASGWSGCRVGLSPTGKRRLFTAQSLGVVAQGRPVW